MAGIASIPERASSLERTLESIAPQVDEVHLSLNGYTERPAFLDRFPNVHATIRATNGGDAEKFAAVDDWDGYVATIDDDLLYPADYIETLIAGIERYDRLRAVSFHGGTTSGYSAKIHSAATVKRLRCLGTVDADDLDVNTVGTGVLGWHTAHVPIWRDLFRTPNMADVYFSCHAHRMGIPLAVLAHEQGWLQDIQPPGPSIYESNRASDGTSLDTHKARQRELETIDWTAAPERPHVRVSIATCSRPALLLELLHDLAREARFIEIEVAVYEDPTAANYVDARDFCRKRGWTWHRFERRLGRDLHCELVTRELRDCKRSRSGWFVFLPDDVRMTKHGILRAIDTWHRLDDPATLTLWRVLNHEGQMNWTGLVPEERDAAFEIFHVDGIYLCRRDTLAFLNYRCPPISAIRRKGRTSSGVGRAMSIALHTAGKRMYRVKRSLAVPVKDVPSVMNPDACDRVHPSWACL
jgi:hypothetical protein